MLHSYRETNSPSVQIVVAEPPSDFDDNTHYADIDIDLGHPSLDAKGFMIHIGELLHPDRTNHLRLRSKLTKSPAKEHLHYKVVAAR